MSYFRERNNLKADYSGYQAVSASLRKRIKTVYNKYISHIQIGVGQEDRWISSSILEYQLALNLEVAHIDKILSRYDYGSVFESIEIYLVVAKKELNSMRYKEVLGDLQIVFTLSGSVYFIDDDGKVKLQIDKVLASDLQDVEDVLKPTPKAHEEFFNAVANLFSRKDTSENIIKDIYIAFENYLKDITEKSSFGAASNYLQEKILINKIQKSILDKIYEYRSRTDKVAHSGDIEKPGELDTLWFLETVISQLKFIDRKLKQQHKLSNQKAGD